MYGCIYTFLGNISPRPWAVVSIDTLSFFIHFMSESCFCKFYFVVKVCGWIGVCVCVCASVCNNTTCRHMNESQNPNSLFPPSVILFLKDLLYLLLNITFIKYASSHTLSVDEGRKEKTMKKTSLFQQFFTQFRHATTSESASAVCFSTVSFPRWKFNF